MPGPIGSVLTPGLDLERYASLPFASHAVRLVHRRLPGEDRPRRAAVPLAAARRGERATSRSRSASAIDGATARARSAAPVSCAGALARFGLRLLPAPLARLAAGRGDVRARRRCRRRRASARGIASIAEGPRERGGTERARRDPRRGARRRDRPPSRGVESPIGARRPTSAPRALTLDAFTAAAIASGANVAVCSRDDVAREVDSALAGARSVLSFADGIPSHHAPSGDLHDARRPRRARLRAEARRRRERRGVDRVVERSAARGALPGDARGGRRS